MNQIQTGSFIGNAANSGNMVTGDCIYCKSYQVSLKIMVKERWFDTWRYSLECPNCNKRSIFETKDDLKLCNTNFPEN